MIHLAIDWRRVRRAADLLLDRDRLADRLTHDGRVVPDTRRDRVAEALAAAVVARRRDRAVSATRGNGGVLVAVPAHLRGPAAADERRRWFYAHRRELWESLRSWVARHGADGADPLPATAFFEATGYSARERGRGRAPDLGRYLKRWVRAYAREAARHGLRLDLVPVRLRPDQVPENYRRGRRHEVQRMRLAPDGGLT